uniref:Uncharacterized protein n=1 Tax=Ciona intestinalis TaxID=7719 RepID=H2XVF6_CIOIN
EVSGEEVTSGLESVGLTCFKFKKLGTFCSCSLLFSFSSSLVACPVKTSLNFNR